MNSNGKLTGCSKTVILNIKHMDNSVVFHSECFSKFNLKFNKFSEFELRLQTVSRTAIWLKMLKRK